MTKIVSTLLFLLTLVGCADPLAGKHLSRELEDLDTGEWDIRSAQVGYSAPMQPLIYAYAVRGEERRRIRHVDELASLIVAIETEAQVREFYRFISRGSSFLKGSPGTMLSSEDWSRILHHRDINVVPIVSRVENGFTIQRVIREEDTDVPILIREFLRPGSYRWEKIRTIDRLR